MGDMHLQRIDRYEVAVIMGEESWPTVAWSSAYIGSWLCSLAAIVPGMSPSVSKVVVEQCSDGSYVPRKRGTQKAGEPAVVAFARKRSIEASVHDARM